MHTYSYEAALADSAKVNWQVEDLIGGDKRLDFSKPLLAGVARARSASFTTLSTREKLALNQIRGNSYLHIFGFVEQFILPFVHRRGARRDARRRCRRGPRAW